MTGLRAGLEELERTVRRDLELIAHPRLSWLKPRTVGGTRVRDVLIVGAGQGGLATGFALKRDRVDNILLVDGAPYGQEGPWVTFARMPTLRSAKDQTGPDLNVPSLTYQAWHEAQWGSADWQAMTLIPATKWNDYLLWFRHITELPVCNETAVTRITSGRTDDDLPCLAACLSTGETVHARKIVLATGQNGTGRWWMPDFIESLPAPFRAHSADAIDFGRLAGKTLAVLGAGASAFDNAVVALERGAQAVHLFCRRPEPTLVQPYRWLTFSGFLRHIGDMPDEWRWRFMQHILGLREGFPPETWARVVAFENFTMHVGRPWTGARVEDGRVRLETPRGPFTADFVICGTGVDHDPRLRQELAGFADNIATWGDRYTPPAEERNERLARFPYLTPDYAFAEKTPGRTPWIADIHLFGIGTTMSFGPSGSSINAMAIAVPKLAAGVTRGLFRLGLAEYWRDLLAYDEQQVELDPARIA
jgi:FAD-dependent urate hydroxylase